MLQNQNLTINTGTPRHVGGHIVSGGVASAIGAGAIASTKNKDPKNIGKVALKRGIQGAIATGVAIEVANILGNPTRSNLSALGVLALGFTGVYMAEKGIEIDE